MLTGVALCDIPRPQIEQQVTVRLTTSASIQCEGVRKSDRIVVVQTCHGISLADLADQDLANLRVQPMVENSKAELSVREVVHLDHLHAGKKYVVVNSRTFASYCNCAEDRIIPFVKAVGMFIIIVFVIAFLDYATPYVYDWLKSF